MVPAFCEGAFETGLPDVVGLEDAGALEAAGGFVV
jgi:hypothetical protein